MEDEQFLTELHEIVNNYERGSYGQVIREKASYPYLYHLSEIRQNLIDWIPMEKTMRVLECAPACGALTGKLLEKAGAVTCLAEDEMHAQIIRARCKDAGERLAIVVGEAESFLSSGETEGGEKFDVILLVGGFYRQNMDLQGGEYLLSISCTGYVGGEFRAYHRLYDVVGVTVISDKNTVGFYDMNSVTTVERAEA